MNLVDTKVCQYIIPESETNPDAELWEYFLMWKAVDGETYCWLFTDFERKTSIDGNVINSKSQNITKSFEGAERAVTLVAEDLTENQFEIISSITRAKVVIRAFKNGTTENLAVKTSNFIFLKSQFRYNFEIEIAEVELPIMK